MRILSIFLLLSLIIGIPVDSNAAKKMAKAPKAAPTYQLSIPSKQRVVIFVADG